MEKGENKRSGQKIIVISIISAVLLILMCIIGFKLFDKGVDMDQLRKQIEDAQAKLDDSINGGSKSGKLDTSNAKEIKMELQKKTDDSYMNYKINVNPVFKDGKSTGNLMIENTNGNKGLLQVEIINENTKETMYKSPVMEPNSHIQEDKLLKEVTKGKYPAIAFFRSFDPDTKQLMGEAGFKINISVLN